MFKRVKIVAESIPSTIFKKLSDSVNSVTEAISSKVSDKLADSVIDTGLNLMEFNCKFRNLETDLGILKSKASDIETQIKNEEQLGKKKRKREVEEWLKMVQETEKEKLKLEREIQERKFIKSLISGNQVAELIARAGRLKEQSQHFGGILTNHCENRGDLLLTRKLSGATFVENLESVWESLVLDDVRIIGIYGIGGVGKTTLAMHIHDRVLERTEDHRVYWVKVSQQFSVKKLQDDIATAIGIGILGHDNNEERRVAELKRALTQRKDFVLIIDNVCEDFNLERMGYPLGVDGCQLIITTRSFKVCRRVGCQKEFKVNTLDEDEAWNVFVETLEQRTALSPEVEDIAKEVVRHQKGIPQRIINLAQDMRGVTEIREWRNAMAQQLEEDGNSGVVCNS